MEDFRQNPPATLGGSKVVTIKDYKTLTQTDTGVHSPLDMPATSNVLQWFTDDGTKISVRPSGTEPKIKFYVEVKGHMNCAGCYDKATAEAQTKVNAIKADLGI